VVVSRDELVALLQHEVKILGHLTGKIDRAVLDYRPTPGQRTTIELLRYLTMMGPALVDVAESGTFDPAAWTVRERAADGLGLDECRAAIAGHADLYARQAAGWSEAWLRAEIAPWGERSSRGRFIVQFVLCGYTAYRMQLFLYLKASGRDELGTINLWDGVDPPPKAN
jgi:hypothetical protein